MDETTAAGARQAIGIYLTQPLNATLTQAGAYGLTLTCTGTTDVTFPTTGTLTTTASTLAVFAATTSAQLRGVISDETGTGSLVFATSPTLVTPVLGAATATSVNKVAITAPATSATLTIADGGSLVTSGAFSITFTATAGTSVTLPTSGTLYGTASGSITSLQLKTSLSDETGSGAAVFATSPTLVTPVLGAATATSINGIAFTNGGALATLAMSGGATVDFSGGDDVTFTTGGATTVTLPTSGTLATLAGTEAISNKTITASTLRPSVTAYNADGAVTHVSGLVNITKGSAAALTVAAPSSIDGTRMTILSTTAFAHVVTFTGGTLWDGTAGVNSTVTFPALAGAAVTVVAVGSLWYVESSNAVTIAP
jgi:hypothetical protein